MRRAAVHFAYVTQKALSHMVSSIPARQFGTAKSAHRSTDVMYMCGRESLSAPARKVNHMHYPLLLLTQLLIFRLPCLSMSRTPSGHKLKQPLITSAMRSTSTTLTSQMLATLLPRTRPAMSLSKCRAAAITIVLFPPCRCMCIVLALDF